MVNLEDYINSGILEMYSTGIASVVEQKEVEQMALIYPEINKELQKIQKCLENYIQLESKAPNSAAKAFLLATIDFTERLKNGEQLSDPPILNERSKVSDYYQWINKPGAQLSYNFDGLSAYIINSNKDVTSAIIWIKEYAPEEVHHKEYEKFLILEGTCTITIENENFNLVAGNYLSIPPFKHHFVKVTSAIPCKAILQRVAA